MRKRISLVPLIFFFILLSNCSFAADGKNSQSKTIKKALAASESLFKRRPERAQYFFPPGYTTSMIDSEVVAQYSLNSGELATTMLNNVRTRLVDLGLSLTAGENKRNLLRLYKLIYSKLPKQLKSKLPPYKEVKSLPTRELKGKYLDMQKLIRRRFDFILKKIPPSELLSNSMIVNPIGDCDAELGAEGAGTDSEISARCLVGDYSPTGLFTNTEFPVKNDLTCIKDQGRRGTCAAHATAATLESREMWQSGTAQNLSEQHIYYTGETEGDVQISLYNMQTSGLSTGTMLQEYENRNLPFYFERDWNYNRSPFIQAQTADLPTATFIYPQSCTASYTGEECNLYAWQTGANVALLGVPNPLPAPTGPSAVQRLSSFSFILSDGPAGLMTQTALQTAIILLSADIPLVLSFTSTDALQASTTGYVRYAAGDTPRGGHAVEMIGFVDNSNLPAGVTAAVERGYFIVKNSWGISSGDCGFYYLDFAYVRHYLEYVSILEI